MAHRGGSVTMTEDPSHYLSSSISSLSSQRAQSSWIARTYRHAAQLYLTRRLSEALEAIEPIITPEYKSPISQINGDGADEAPQAAPVAASSRGTRVKVWSFYLTLLNAIIELGPEEGKLSFGSTKWRAIAAKAREGTAWEDVVKHGYGGSEGDVDGEVVANLATLLLTHMPTQKLNQTRLETYLSASSTPSFDITAHLSRPHAHRTNSSTSGTDTPRDLNTRLKLLELYTLHVLPRNEEWDYAREFISMSEVLDDERREAFLFALTSLREEKEHDKIREGELKKRQEAEMESRRRREEEERSAAAAEEDRRKKGEDERSRSAGPGVRNARPPSSNASSSSRPGAKATGKVAGANTNTNGNGKGNAQAHGNSSNHDHRSSTPRHKAKPPAPPQTLYHRAGHMLSALQSSILNARQSVTKNPAGMLRMLLVMFALAMAFARRDVRERIRRMFRDAWERVRRTVGMGVKVSYI